MSSSSPASFPPPRGFTLIELLTVIAIIGILAAIIIPTVGKVRESARRAEAASNVRQLQLANNLHAQDHRGRFAPARLPGNSWWYSNYVFLNYLGHSYTENQSWGAARRITDELPVFRSSVSGRPDNRSWPDFGYNRTGLLESQLEIGYNQAQVREPSRRIAFIDSLFTLVRVQDINLYNGTEVRQNFEPAYRHDNRALVAFFDGSARMVHRDELTNPANEDMWFPAR